MILFCSVEKYTKEKGWHPVWSTADVKHGDTIRLKVDGKMNTVRTDVLKVSEKQQHRKGMQMTISVLGFTWRYCCDAKEVVMISSGRSTAFELNI